MKSSQTGTVIDVEGFASPEGEGHSQKFIDFESQPPGQIPFRDWDELLPDRQKALTEVALELERHAWRSSECCCIAVYGFYNPVLFAVASTVFEGVVQGASYDLVKTYVVGGLHYLRSRTPPSSRATAGYRSASKTEILIGWKGSRVNGKSRRDFQFSFKREHKWVSNHKRLSSQKLSRSHRRKDDA